MYYTLLQEHHWGLAIIGMLEEDFEEDQDIGRLNSAEQEDAVEERLEAYASHFQLVTAFFQVDSSSMDFVRFLEYLVTIYAFPFHTMPSIGAYISYFRRRRGSLPPTMVECQFLNGNLLQLPYAHDNGFEGLIDAIRRDQGVPEHERVRVRRLAAATEDTLARYAVLMTEIAFEDLRTVRPHAIHSIDRSGPTPVLCSEWTFITGFDTVHQMTYSANYVQWHTSEGILTLTRVPNRIRILFRGTLEELEHAEIDGLSPSDVATIYDKSWKLREQLQF